MEKDYQSTKIINNILKYYKFNNNIHYCWEKHYVIKKCKYCGDACRASNLKYWKTGTEEDFFTEPDNLYCKNCNEEIPTHDELVKKINEVNKYYLVKESTNDSIKLDNLSELETYGINKETAKLMIESHLIYSDYLLYKENKKFEDFLYE